MAFPSQMASSSSPHLHSFPHQLGQLHLYPRLQSSRPSLLRSLPLRLRLRLRIPRPQLPHIPLALPSSNDGNNNNNNNSGGGDGQGGGGDGGESDGNRRAALSVLAQLGRKLESLPDDFAAALEGGRVTGDIVRRFLKMDASPLLRGFMQLQGFRDRLLADELFLFKLAIECGVGIFTKVAAEYERRKETFVKEIDMVLHVVVMAIAAEFMLVYLSAPTVSLQTSLGTNAGPIASLPNNWLHIISQAVSVVRSYVFVRRLQYSTIVVRTGVTNALIQARSTVGKELDDKVENIPGASLPRKVEENELAVHLGVEGVLPGGPSISSLFCFHGRSWKNEKA